MNETKIGLKELDKKAYDIVCNWHKVIEFDPLQNGIDYSYIIRFYLWDKVGRALRVKNKISFDEVEKYTKDKTLNTFYFEPHISKGTHKKPFFKTKKTLFLPFQAPHTKLLVDALRQESKLVIISKYMSSQFNDKQVVKQLNYNYSYQFATNLNNAVLSSFKLLNVELVQKDITLLNQQIFGAVKTTSLAIKELKHYKPNALFVHSDNHPPYINYVLAANSLGIPSFTYQHGLDCEHYYLDDCFSNYVAVWSENRKQKYLVNSIIQPKKYDVVGNFLMEDLPKLNNEIKANSKRMVFVTRPHMPIKCYSPSRNYLEGLMILKTILEVLQTSKSLELIIKPHPMDDCSLYTDLINEMDLYDQVEITSEKIFKIIKETNVIITEDSTAGVEALNYKLPCVHVHFADSQPVLPFVEYGAAFPGRNPEELKSNLAKALNLSSVELKKMNLGQQKMIKDLLPKGNVSELVKFITQNIK